MNKEKSEAYKKLVANMQKKYPAYGTNFVSKLPGTKSIATATSKEIAREFYENFSDIKDFYNVLASWGLDWTKTSEEKTTRMWAINALANAIADGFDFEKAVEKNLDSSVPLWSALVDKEYICKEINLYTYWQGLGYAEKTPRIKYLLVAQDWGNCFGDNSRINAINAGNKNLPYFDKTNSFTDKHLMELFKILGYDDIMTRHEELFFTNFCLGYRSGNIGGGMTKKVMMNDAAEFKKLCEILEPENILCLGRITFESVLESLTGEKIKISDGYDNFIEQNSFLTATCGTIQSKIFPLVHCGGMGTAFRSLEKQKKDWEKILRFDQKVTKISKTALYGAILGDIIGSPFEFRNIRQKSKDFELFSTESKFTDDTVMTIAVADAILRTGDEEDGRVLFKNVENEMLYYGKKYPNSGYGGRFGEWLESKNPKPYNSFGNGSAMRVSAAGWICNSMFDTRECARMTARPTHNHPEGVKGAMAVASAIFLARTGRSKEEIKNYIEYEFGYNLSRSLDDIRKTYEFDETCQGSVPESIIAFLESENFEDAIRNAVSLGGDADTQAAIAGSIAEAFYGIPENLIEKCREYLPKNMLEILDDFNAKIFGTGKNHPLEFTRKYLSNDLLTKKFFDDVKFIHTSASGAMGEPGIFELWTKNFEHYRCNWTGNFDVKKFHKAFMQDDDTPFFDEPVKNGWCFHYMGCGHNFYIKEELNEKYLKQFDEGNREIIPVEEFMIEVLSS